jgi:hypothetical protein
LQTDEHDHAGLPLLGREGRLPRIQHVAELREDGLQQQQGNKLNQQGARFPPNRKQTDRRKSTGFGPDLLHDAALVGPGGERLEVDDALDVGLHVADHLELNVGLQERARDLVEAVVEHLLVDHRRVAHLRERAGDAPAELREHHLAGLGLSSAPRRSLLLSLAGGGSLPRVGENRIRVPIGKGLCRGRRIMDVIGCLHGTPARPNRCRRPDDWLTGRPPWPGSTRANSASEPGPTRKLSQAALIRRGSRGIFFISLN